MKKLTSIFIILLLLFVSNPSKADYVEWAKGNLMGESHGLVKLAGDTIAPPIINAATTVNNYNIFTIYETKNIDGTVHRTIGIFKNFIYLGTTNSSLKVSSDLDKPVNNNEQEVVEQPSKVEQSNDEIYEPGICGIISEGTYYNNYTNGRFGFSIDYPKEFIITQPPQNGDGLEFKSYDGKSYLVVYGSNNAMNETVKELYEAEINNIDNVSYQVLKNNWFVVSWIEAGKAHYDRTIVGEGSINSFRFYCPESQLDQYYDVIEHISKSFKSGNLNQAY